MPTNLNPGRWSGASWSASASTPSRSPPRPTRASRTIVCSRRLAGLAQSLYKFAFDLRILQSPPFGEWAEPFGRRQVGSSAMPFKRNPIAAENMAAWRATAALPRVAWDNAAHSLLERTLDDSANRRTLLPEAFLAADEMLTPGAAGRRPARRSGTPASAAAYGPFAASERLLMERSRPAATARSCTR